MQETNGLELHCLNVSRAKELADKWKVSPVLAQLMLNRGIDEVAAGQHWLYDGLAQLGDPNLMGDMPKAVALLKEALEQQEPIFVCGDYDVDGIMATVVLVEGLQALGALVDYHIPERFDEGYGLSPVGVEQAVECGASVLVTVDCGSSSADSVAQAQQYGLKVIVTDHHVVPESKPSPEAFINPHLSNCHYPEKRLCGAAVAWKVLCALYLDLGKSIPVEYLDLVACATIADVIPLQNENRLICRLGLEIMAKSLRPGLAAVAKVGRLDLSSRASTPVSFFLAPRLNSAGRLESATVAVDMLLSQDEEECLQLANRLEEINAKRHELQKSALDELEDRLASRGLPLKTGEVILEVGSWHLGILGICAGHLSQTHGVPSFVATSDGSICQGSARAPEGTSLYEILLRCAPLFTRFGGHARAGGFAFAEENADELRRALGQACQELAKPKPAKRVDLVMPLACVTAELVDQVSALEPVGEGNQRALFYAQQVRFTQPRWFGNYQQHLNAKVWQPDGSFISFPLGEQPAASAAVPIACVGFQMAGDKDKLYFESLAYDLVYYPDLDRWAGRTQIRVIIDCLVRPCPMAEAWGKYQRSRAAGSGEAGAKEQGQLAFEQAYQDCEPVVDCRAILDSRAYIKAVAALAKEPLVVVTDPDQLVKVQKWLDIEASQVVTWRQLANHAADSSDLFFLQPPVSLDSLSVPCCQQAKHWHVFGGPRQLAATGKLVDDYYLDRERMLSVYRALAKALGSESWDKEHFAGKLKGIAGQLHLSDSLVSQASVVLGELSILVWSAGRVHLQVPQSRLDLDSSALYRRLSAIPHSYAKARQAWGGMSVELTR